MSAAYSPIYTLPTTGYGTTAATFDGTMPEIEAMAASGNAKNLSASAFEALFFKIKDLSYKVGVDPTKNARLWDADVKIFNNKFPGKNISSKDWMGYMHTKAMPSAAAGVATKGMTKVNA